jgi:asparagine synthase (glutamine-hydrolysing)
MTADVIRTPFAAGAAGDNLARALRTDLQMYMVDDILTLTDRLSMWHSLELRVPYLDHRLVELMQTVPTSLKIRGTTQKYLLKKIAERWLPHEMIYHRKQGFEAPMGYWLRGPLLGYFYSVVNESAARRLGCFDFTRIRQLRDEHVDGRRKNSKVLFSLLMFFLWQRQREAVSA